MVFRNHEYVTLKAYVSAHRQARNEFNVMNHISHWSKKISGPILVRTMRETFQVLGKKGPHQCLIHDPLGLTASQIQEGFGGKIPRSMLKAMVHYLLLGLEFLHAEAHIVHTGM